MTASDYLTQLDIIIAAIGVLFVVLTIYEFSSLQKLRRDFQKFRSDLAAEHYRYQQAAHRVIASYGIKEPGDRIGILLQALERDPSVYNGYNALGYAYLEMDEKVKAVDAFRGAIQYHPEDKAGYCDLAYAYLEQGDSSLCTEYLHKAIAVDPTARMDIEADSRFASVSLNR